MRGMSRIEKDEVSSSFQYCQQGYDSVYTPGHTDRYRILPLNAKLAQPPCNLVA